MSAIEVSGEKVKAMWDKRLLEIFCDICIKEILKGNRPGTHFTKDGWLKIMTNFEKESGVESYKRTVDALDDWWESRLKDVNNEIPEENEEEIVRNDVHILNDVQIDGNGQKRKNPEISSSHFKTGRKKSSKQIRGATRLSNQIEKLCNAADNMSQATSSLTPVVDPYSIPQAVKVLDKMSEEVSEASPLYFFALRLLLNKDNLSINPKIRALWLKTKIEDS
ncbi:L10-interacting MYB domain-containing protein-like [Gossypium arboreum]|uniref:L10-interacting MYB domain-containing protein-like n=1 Tax=Gossypium arboreum TaxID=29729 RepID=UPI0022F164DE|nr:L10-interacting MYB domain-containing protein-like [Gossypium arboreum]